MTALYVSPATPLKLHFFAYNRSYMEPYFYQSWKLFAPDPAGISRYIMAACRVETDGSAWESEPTDATTRFEETHQRFRVGPAQRVARSLLAPIFSLTPAKDPILAVIEHDARRSKQPELQRIASQLAGIYEDERARGLRIVARVAALECRRRFPDQAVVAVRPWIVFVHSPKFSQRDKQPHQGTYQRFALDWQPYESFAELAGFE